MSDVLNLLSNLVHTSDLAQLSAILGVVMIITALIKRLNQPLIIWYLIAGVVVGPLFLWLIDTSWGHSSFIELFSHLWISLLLFMVWVGLNLQEIKEQGKVALGVWMIQIITTVFFWYILAIWLWYDTSTSVFLAIWLTFSSTIVIVKLLTDKEENETVYGKISIWVLIVQDLVVMLVMMLIALQWWWSWWAHGSAGDVLFLEGFILIWIVILNAKFLLPKVVKRLASEQEFLVLVGIWYCLILWTLFQLVWFSFETWCLLAGMSFATSPFRMQLTSKLVPLRDFFLVLFFIALGLNLSRNGIDQHIPLLIWSLILVMIWKPLVLYLACTLFWYTHQVSFKTASSLWQISEFWFIILTIWVSLWYISDPSLMSVMVLVWLISIWVSSYLTLNNNRLFQRFKKYAWSDTTASTEEIWHDETERVEVILFWYGKIGSHIAGTFNKKKISHVVIDHNPELVQELEERPGEYIFADASNIDVYKHMFHEELKMVISTTRDLEDDLFIIQQVTRYNPDIIIIVVSNHQHHALSLYEAWADHVIMPDALWAKHATTIIERIWFDIDTFLEEKLGHMWELER